MQLVHLIFVLLFTASSTFNGTVASEDQTDALQSRTSRLLTKNYLVNDGGIEERGVFYSFLSKLKMKGLLSSIKNTGIGNKMDSLRKDPEVAAVMANSPVVKKLKTAVEKDPKFFAKLKNNPESVEKLVKNPDIQRAAAAVDKSKVKIDKNDIQQLRMAVPKNPSTGDIFIQGLDVVEGLMGMAVIAGFAAFFLVLIVVAFKTAVN